MIKPTIEQIKSDRLKARKIKDRIKSNLLSTILGEIDRLPPQHQDAEKVIRKLIKSNSDCITQTKSDNTTHCLATENAILMGYLPQQLEGDELAKFIAELHIDCSKNISGGVKIGIVMRELKHKDMWAHGKEVSNLLEDK